MLVTANADKSENPKSMTSWREEKNDWKEGNIMFYFTGKVFCHSKD